MHGSSYIWGFLVPASILLFVGFYLSAQLSGAVKLTAAIQIDQRARNKIIKRRGLQIGLFFKVGCERCSPVLLSPFPATSQPQTFHKESKGFQCQKHFIFFCDNLNHDYNLSVSVTILIKTSSTLGVKLFWAFAFPSDFYLKVVKNRKTSKVNDRKKAVNIKIVIKAMKKLCL